MAIDRLCRYPPSAIGGEALGAQQSELALDPAPVVADRAIRSDHAMTWDVNCDRIDCDRVADRALSRRRAGRAGQRLIGGDCARRNLPQTRERATLKIARHQAQIDRTMCDRARVAVQQADYFVADFSGQRTVFDDIEMPPQSAQKARSLVFLRES